MKITKGINPVLRAVGVMSAVAIVAGGATYAALSSTATLSDNTVTSANANLQVWNGSIFTNTAPGFHVTGLIPGIYTPDQQFYFKNAGDAALAITAKVPNPPAVPGASYDFHGWQNLKVRFTSYAPDCPNTPGANVVETNMAALLGLDPTTGESTPTPPVVSLPCNPLDVSAQGNNAIQATEGNYSVAFKIESDAVDGPNPGVGSFNLQFDGKAVADTDVTP